MLRRAESRRRQLQFVSWGVLGMIRDRKRHLWRFFAGCTGECRNHVARQRCILAAYDFAKELPRV